MDTAKDCNNHDLIEGDYVCFVNSNSCAAYLIKNVAYTPNESLVNIQHIDGTNFPGFVESNVLLKIDKENYTHYFI